MMPLHFSMTALLRTALVTASLGIGILSSSAVAEEPNQEPNIVIIFADDVGYGDVGCYGATHMRTPHIDQLAAEGRRFTDAHSASAACSPSRYALLTGRYPSRRDLFDPLFLRSPLVVDPDRTTVADIAKEAGYATACIGKWHLGFGNQSPTDWNAPLKPGPLELGFDYYFGVPVLNSHPPFVYVENHRVVEFDPGDPFVYGKSAKTREFDEKMDIDKIGGATAAHAAYDDEAVGTTLTGKATRWIRERSGADERFFLYFATTNIHHPFTPAPRFQGTSEAGRYGDFIHELDWIVGEVIKTLEETGTADNTLVIFTSDNGGMLNRGGQDAWRRGHRMNADLLGFKFDAWEGGHRVPLIVRWPGHVEADSKSDSLVSNVDLFATIATMLDRPLAADEGPDSFNALPLLTGTAENEVRDHMLYIPQSRSHVALREGDWVYIPAQGNGGFGGTQIGGHLLGGPAAHRLTGHVNSDIEDGQIKPDAPSAQLYHLGDDLSQKVNVIREHPEIARNMAARLARAREGPTAPHAALAAAPFAPPAGWKWDRPFPGSAKQRDGAIELRTEAGRIWAGEGNRNRLMTIEPVDTGDTVTAEIELVDAVGKWEQCGLLLHQHDDAFVKLVVEHIDGMHYVVMAWERPNGRKVLAQIEIPQASAQLKLEVDDHTVTGYWRLDPSASWQSAAESDLPGDGEHRFGVFTQDGDPDRPRWALIRDLRL